VSHERGECTECGHAPCPHIAGRLDAAGAGAARARLARNQAEVDAGRLRSALRAVEAHHAAMCDAAGRPQTNSNTLRIVRAALAGCDHLPGDVCRVCHPSLPICARHPEAPLRRFGPLWRCSECGEDGTLLQGAAMPPEVSR
jgi:hypothetical protein